MEQGPDSTTLYSIWAVVMLAGGIAWIWALKVRAATFGRGAPGPPGSRTRS